MDKEKNKEWITTAELISYLKAHPDDEKECRPYLGHRLGSTHYWYWDAQKRTFMHTRDWPFSPISESEVKEWYGNSKWKTAPQQKILCKWEMREVIGNICKTFPYIFIVYYFFLLPLVKS